MKTGITLIALAVVMAILMIGGGIYGTYQFEKSVQSYWNLAEKASTIEKKAEYIDKFVTALEEQKYQGNYNAIIFTTPDNSYDYNFEMLKSFQSRLHQIQSMDIKSFEYQTAIQQITAQEQGEAQNMLNQFKGIWWRTNYFILWNWICAINILLTIAILVIGIIKTADA